MIKWKLPDKFVIEPTKPSADLQKKLEELREVAIEASKRSYSNIWDILAKKDQPIHDAIRGKLEANYEEVQRDSERPNETKPRSVEEYARMTFDLVGYMYAINKTDTHYFKDKETGQDASPAVLSVALTDFSETFGEQLAMQIFREISYNVDVVLEERYGKGK